MKRKLHLITSTAVSSVLAFSALAQDTPNPQNHDRYRKPHAAREGHLNGAAKASDLIGITVKNYQDEKLGKVEDFAVDVQSGRIVQVILATGGFIGLGEKLTAVPPAALHHDVAQKVLHLEANEEKLKSAPAFEMSKWSECSDSQHLSAIYRHYGEEAALAFIQQEEAVVDGQRTTDAAPKTGKAKSQSLIPVSRLGHLQKASKIIGTPVVNLQEENLGEVENMVVDVSSGRVLAVIVSSGAFLGLEDVLSAVPPSALRYTKDWETLRLDASKEVLSKAPHFKASEWPDFGQPAYAGGVYQAYQTEPYFTGSGAKEPDNTARNAFGQEVKELTPLDQGNGKADVERTAQIRKEILAGKDMSVNAQNVKIITNKGHVTLRGPVNSAEEKRLICEIADRIATAEQVDNQLEVRLVPGGKE